MEKVERILWRVVPGMKRFLIFSKTLSFSRLVFPTYISWLLRIPSPLSWALFNYVLATFACHSFTNPAILSWIFGSSKTRRKISDLGFERNIQILEGFGWTFYFDLCIPLLLMHGSCLAWFAALVVFCFSTRLQRSSSMKKQEEEEEEEAEYQLRIEEAEEKAEDMKKWMVLKTREDEMKKEEEARREELMKKVMEKLKKEKEKHKGYRRKWEEEKEEKARLNGELRQAATKWAEYCQTFLQNYEEERRKWEEEKSELTAKLSAAQKSSDLYQQLLHECHSF
ncbi:hypothetical protein PVL29_002854 [Vitis rotundifolia]|uniref:Uncharacterized protein n=1 Tax=Vitis rotundifolia TaxID=103349 RepID=A0AA39E012_VITRO|nr:hypothetical protein PVL29_002854 [Vitis rotundifolia]